MSYEFVVVVFTFRITESVELYVAACFAKASFAAFIAALRVVMSVFISVVTLVSVRAVLNVSRDDLTLVRRVASAVLSLQLSEAVVNDASMEALYVDAAPTRFV